MFEELVDGGFQVEFLAHAKAVLSADFPEVADELKTALLEMTIPAEEIIAGCGGKAKETENFESLLRRTDWSKLQVVTEKRINDVQKDSKTLEVSFARETSDGERIAVQIAWNEKEAVFDKTLKNFKRLHADGVISVGVIVTRGTSLQDSLRKYVRKFLTIHEIGDVDDLKTWGYEPNREERKAIAKRVTRTKNPRTLHQAIADHLHAEKFGAETTHWEKLEAQIARGASNPCPVVLIGLPASVVTFKGAKAAMAEIDAGDE